MTTVSFFSAGVSSAVATKLIIDEVDEIFYTHIEDQHPDTMRFVKECEGWFGKPVGILQSPLKSVENACLMAGGKGYINGIGGAACTLRLKRRVRREWELPRIESGEKLCYVWGMDCNESGRAYSGIQLILFSLLIVATFLLPWSLLQKPRLQIKGTDADMGLPRLHAFADYTRPYYSYS